MRQQKAQASQGDESVASDKPIHILSIFSHSNSLKFLAESLCRAKPIMLIETKERVRLKVTGYISDGSNLDETLRDCQSKDSTLRPSLDGGSCPTYSDWLP
jgi:hypothetical protein